MDMTFDQYIQNPMGIRNAVISNREMHRKLYTEKWDAIKLRENGKIDCMIMTSKTDYYVYLKIPSEVVPKFYYDVVVRFYPPKDKKSIEMERTLTNYNVQFYSNDPSFVFTFAHAFSKNDMIIKDLNPRMSKQALKQNADVRNPGNQVGYVKSLYFAYLEIKKRGLFQKVVYSSLIDYDKNYLLANIQDADLKIDARQREGETIAKKKKRGVKQQQTNDKRKSIVNDKANVNDHVITPKAKISGKTSNISAKSKITGKSKSSGRRV